MKRAAKSERQIFHLSGEGVVAGGGGGGGRDVVQLKSEVDVQWLTKKPHMKL